MKLWVDIMASWLNNKLTKWQIDKNPDSKIQQVDKMAS